uniref:MBD domain-containing protein n=1 Tax=Aegilops tauschii subsp. strangulata TaxID=200361 RepID=A0A452ZMY0_AEGTS
MEESISDDEEVTLLEDLKEKLEDGMEQPPDWLPDGWIMEVRRDDNGALYKAHEWLPDGWLVEVRAGGEKMEKMYKILATVEFNPHGLPQGWVKEVVYRKSEERIRKDSYFTDPVSHKVFRSLNYATHYINTGEVKKHALVQRASVHEVYNFEKSADMHEIFRKKPRKNVKARKTLESSLKPRRSSTRKKKNCNEHTSYRCKFPLSSVIWYLFIHAGVAHISFFRFVHTVT